MKKIAINLTFAVLFTFTFGVIMIKGFERADHICSTYSKQNNGGYRDCLGI